MKKTTSKDKVIVIAPNPYSEYIAWQEKARKKREALEKQAELNFQKWLDSERKKVDMSGMEPWCMFCNHRTEDLSCGCDNDLRTSEAICVEAYNKMQEKLGKQ